MLELIPLLGYRSCWIKEQGKTIFFTFFRSLSKQPIFRNVTTGFPAKWRQRNERRNSILMTNHYPETNFPHGTTNQNRSPYLGSFASSVWIFCARFSDVILRASRNVGCFLRLVFFATKQVKSVVYLFERGGLSNPIKWLTFHLCSERGITEDPVKEPCRGAGQSKEPSPYYS